MRILALPILAIATQPALAAERSFTVTDFDRIDVSGPFVVEVRAARAPAAKAIGDRVALDRISVEMRGRTLRISPSANGWGGWPGDKATAPKVLISVPKLSSASMRGSGALSIDALRGQVMRLGVAGNGRLSVARVDGDRLLANLVGSGTLAMGGRVAIARVVSEGSGSVEAAGLVVENLDLLANSSGTVQLSARRTAKLVSAGAGDVTVTGDAACTVSAPGAGLVRCGKEAAAK